MLRHPSTSISSPERAIISGFISSSSGKSSPNFITTTARDNPICGAARPTPPYSCMESAISSNSVANSLSNFWTGSALRRKTGSPSFLTSITAIYLTFSHKIMGVVIKNSAALFVQGNLSPQVLHRLPVLAAARMTQKKVPTVSALESFQRCRARIQQLQPRFGHHVGYSLNMVQHRLLLGRTDQHPGQGGKGWHSGSGALSHFMTVKAQIVSCQGIAQGVMLRLIGLDNDMPRPA